MDTFKISCCLAFTLVTVSCIDQRGLEEANAGWSKLSNGLSAKLIFKVDASSSHAKVVHPTIKLRNEVDTSIKLLWCIYDAGTFVVKTSRGVPVQKAASSRSGPQGAKVIVTDLADAEQLSTASFQAELKSGVYSVDYRLVVDQTTINRMLEDYDWIREEPSSLWTGDIALKNVQLRLE